MLSSSRNAEAKMRSEPVALMVSAPDPPMPRVMVNVLVAMAVTRNTSGAAFDDCAFGTDTISPTPKSVPSAVRMLVTAERSEEHTSELQSRLHLVCRLLLEKKKKRELHTPIYFYTFYTSDLIARLA